jgi:hypothetical protein
MFARFPWNTSYWTEDTVKKLHKGFVQVGMVSWLNHMLRGRTAQDSKDIVPGSLAVASLLTWWMHVILWLYGDPTGIETFLEILSLFGVLLLIIVRLAAYLNPGYRAPINIWGRLFTGRWIIPQHDVVFLAPLCLPLSAIASLTLGRLCSLSLIHQCDLLVWTQLVLAISLPPRLNRWRLTGAHRMVEKEKRAQRQTKMAVSLDLDKKVNLWD